MYTVTIYYCEERESVKEVVRRAQEP